MVEPQTQEIGIDEIMQRIREEVERRKKRSGQDLLKGTEQAISVRSVSEEQSLKKSFDDLFWRYGRKYKGLIKRIPILNSIARKQHSRLMQERMNLPEPSQPHRMRLLDMHLLPNFLNYHGFLVETKQEGLKGRVKSFLFKFIRYFASWQEQINRALYQELMAQRAKIDEKEREVQDLLNQQRHHLGDELVRRDKVLEDHGNRIALFDQAKDDLYRELSDQMSKTDETSKSMKALFDQEIGELKSELAERNRMIEDLNHRLVDFTRVGEALSREINTQKEKLEEVERQAGYSVGQEINAVKMEFTQTYQNFNDAIESMKKELSRLLEVQSAINDMTKQMRDHKLNILDQQRRLTLLLDEARKRLPKPISTKQIQNILKEEDHLLDAMYVAFEDRFRGTREDIQGRLEVYLPYIKQAKAGKEVFPIIDLGCGRGEWLEVLKEEGYVAKGIEINRAMLEVCRERGLDVIESDVIQYLRGQKANSIGAITGFHLLEHLSLKILICLLDECLRVLSPRGMIIFETPNPENLIVGAYSFHYDPTHTFPLIPDSLDFIAQQRGFVKTQILRLHKYSDFNKVDQTTDVFKNKWFYSETDFALIGYKS